MNVWQIIAVLAAVSAFLEALLAVGPPQAIQVLAICSITFAVLGQSFPPRTSRG